MTSVSYRKMLTEPGRGDYLLYSFNNYTFINFLVLLNYGNDTHYEFEVVNT